MSIEEDGLRRGAEGIEMMVRVVPCGGRECRQAERDPEREEQNERKTPT